MRTIKDAITDRVVGWLDNPHTSISAFVFLGLEIASYIWPQHKDLFNNCAKAALAYGILQAGDAKPRSSQP